jgi:nitrogen fixation protein
VVQHLNSDGTVVDFYSNVPGSRTSGSGKDAVFNFRKSKDLGIQVAVITAGSGYAVNDTITIPGTDLEEDADLILTVSEIDGSGGVVTLAFA